MKKVILAALAVLGIAVVTPAFGDPIVALTDPTPNGQFTGTYVISNDDPATPENEYQQGTQTGYIGLYGSADDPTSGGIVVCNGNAALTRPDDGSPLQGYIWVGPGMAASHQSAAAPGNVAGAGDNSTDANGGPTGNSPCPDANPQGVGG
jgi:hypothetical protein